jgi:hypothetical protein
MKNSRNSWAIWEQTEGEVFDPKMIKLILQITSSNSQEIVWGLGWISKAPNWRDHELTNWVQNWIAQILY